MGWSNLTWPVVSGIVTAISGFVVWLVKLYTDSKRAPVTRETAIVANSRQSVETAGEAARMALEQAREAVALVKQHQAEIDALKAAAVQAQADRDADRSLFARLVKWIHGEFPNTTIPADLLPPWLRIEN